MTLPEHELEHNIPSEEVQYYRLEQIERLHTEQYNELLTNLREIREAQQRNNELLIEHDVRIKQLEAKNNTQSKYVYGIVIMVLTQLFAELLQVLSGF